jgi:CRISPR-associated protein Cas7/Csd2, subtype I-C/DVULG
VTASHVDPAVRHDIVFVMDVTDGNPNGDPDAGNQPRTDDETGHGLITDVAVKRKVRDTVALLRADNSRYGIFVEAGHALNTRIAEGIDQSGARHGGKIDVEEAQQWLCDHYFDIRMFGAVLSTGKAEEGSKGRGAGQIRGPLQLTFSRSVDPITPMDHAITRVTQTKQEDIDKGERTEMGSKWTVPYGLYVGKAFYSAARGVRTGVTTEDLEVLWQAFQMMFDHDRSATRGEMKLCGLFVFSHRNALGVAPAAALTNRIQITRTDVDKPARAHTDYQLTLDNEHMPEGVTLTSVLNLWP